VIPKEPEATENQEVSQWRIWVRSDGQRVPDCPDPAETGDVEGDQLVQPQQLGVGEHSYGCDVAQGKQAKCAAAVAVNPVGRAPCGEVAANPQALPGGRMFAPKWGGAKSILFVSECVQVTSQRGPRYLINGMPNQLFGT
jgi:hypothetical protein